MVARSTTGTLHKRIQLGVHHIRIHCAVISKCSEATVRSGNHSLPADNVGEPRNALGDQLRMLNKIGG